MKFKYKKKQIGGTKYDQVFEDQNNLIKDYRKSDLFKKRTEIQNKYLKEKGIYNIDAEDKIYKPSDNLGYTEINIDNNIQGHYNRDTDKIEYNTSYKQGLNDVRQVFSHELGHAYNDTNSNKFVKDKFGKNSDVKIDQVYKNLEDSEKSGFKYFEEDDLDKVKYLVNPNEKRSRIYNIREDLRQQYQDKDYNRNYLPTDIDKSKNNVDYKRLKTTNSDDQILQMMNEIALNKNKNYLNKAQTGITDKDIKGYSDGSKYGNEKSITINSPNITMRNTGKRLTAIPMDEWNNILGVHDLDPYSGDYSFNGASKVMEIPKAQTGSNNAVRRYQEMLNKIYGTNLKVDGIWGKNTQAAYAKNIKPTDRDLSKTEPIKKYETEAKKRRVMMTAQEEADWLYNGGVRMGIENNVNDQPVRIETTRSYGTNAKERRAMMTPREEYEFLNGRGIGSGIENNVNDQLGRTEPIKKYETEAKKRRAMMTPQEEYEWLSNGGIGAGIENNVNSKSEWTKQNELDFRSNKINRSKERLTPEQVEESRVNAGLNGITRDTMDYLLKERVKERKETDIPDDWKEENHDDYIRKKFGQPSVNNKFQTGGIAKAQTGSGFDKISKNPEVIEMLRLRKLKSEDKLGYLNLEELKRLESKHLKTFLSSKKQTDRIFRKNINSLPESNISKSNISNLKKLEFERLTDQALKEKETKLLQQSLREQDYRNSLGKKATSSIDNSSSAQIMRQKNIDIKKYEEAYDLVNKYKSAIKNPISKILKSPVVKGLGLGAGVVDVGASAYRSVKDYNNLDNYEKLYNDNSEIGKKYKDLISTSGKTKKGFSSFGSFLDVVSGDYEDEILKEYLSKSPNQVKADQKPVVKSKFVAPTKVNRRESDFNKDYSLASDMNYRKSREIDVPFSKSSDKKTNYNNEPRNNFNKDYSLTPDIDNARSKDINLPFSKKESLNNFNKDYSFSSDMDMVRSKESDIPFSRKKSLNNFNKDYSLTTDMNFVKSRESEVPFLRKKQEGNFNKDFSLTTDMDMVKSRESNVPFLKKPEKKVLVKRPGNNFNKGYSFADDIDFRRSREANLPFSKKPEMNPSRGFSLNTGMNYGRDEEIRIPFARNSVKKDVPNNDNQQKTDSKTKKRFLVDRKSVDKANPGNKNDKQKLLVTPKEDTGADSKTQYKDSGYKFYEDNGMDNRKEFDPLEGIPRPTKIDYNDDFVTPVHSHYDQMERYFNPETEIRMPERKEGIDKYLKKSQTGSDGRPITKSLQFNKKIGDEPLKFGANIRKIDTTIGSRDFNDPYSLPKYGDYLIDKQPKFQLTKDEYKNLNDPFFKEHYHQAENGNYFRNDPYGKKSIPASTKADDGFIKANPVTINYDNPDEARAIQYRRLKSADTLAPFRGNINLEKPSLYQESTQPYLDSIREQRNSVMQQVNSNTSTGQSSLANMYGQSIAQQNQAIGQVARTNGQLSTDFLNKRSEINNKQQEFDLQNDARYYGDIAQLQANQNEEDINYMNSIANMSAKKLQARNSLMSTSIATGLPSDALNIGEDSVTFDVGKIPKGFYESKNKVAENEVMLNGIKYIVNKSTGNLEPVKRQYGGFMSKYNFRKR